MFVGIQLLGLLFIIMMVYFTYLNFKRRNYGSHSFIFWPLIWLVAGLIISFPNILYRFMHALNIERTHDFFYIGAFIILFIVVFNMYVTIKKTHAKVEKLIRVDALKNPIKPSKKSK